MLNRRETRRLGQDVRRDLHRHVQSGNHPIPIPEADETFWRG